MSNTEGEVAPSSWLRQKYRSPENFHVVWGQPRAASGSHSQESEPGRARAHIVRTAELSDASGTLHADSSDPPWAVFPPAENSHHSGTMSSNVSGVQKADNHIVFSDSSASDVSEEWRFRASSSAGGDAEPGMAQPSQPREEVDRSEMPAVSVALHDAGRCKPCMFLRTAVGCPSASECNFCHLPHRRRNMPRPCKSKRERFKALFERKAREAGIQPEDGEAEGLEGDEEPYDLGAESLLPAQAPAVGTSAAGCPARRPGILQL
mmetsp:Transcript_93200/g.268305  ORF Transcript_93200/g.268305 Transcript_93200/m.268305 type:complete len:264 (-) Transcript_93200:72-863(-)